MPDKKTILLLVLPTLFVFGSLQYSYKALQQDDYFHIRYTEMMRDSGPYFAFPWMKHTILNETFYDKHFLYHVLMMPFSFGDLIISGKAGTLFFLLVLAFVSHGVLARNNVKYPVFWTMLLLFGSRPMMLRLMAIRPITLSIIYYLLACHLLFNKKARWIGLLGLIFTWSYSAFPVFLGIVLVFTVVNWITSKQFNYKPLVAAVTGCLGGIVINPYFPTNLIVLKAQYFSGSLSRENLENNLEWVPPNGWEIVTSNWPILLSIFLVVFMVFVKGKKLKPMSLFLFALTGFFGFFFLKVSRGIDQFLPIAVFFCAFAWSDLDLKIPRWAQAVVVLAFTGIVLTNGGSVHSAFSAMEKIDNRGAALWLKENTPKGSDVILANYAAFPQMLFYNQHNYYSHGLDPNYMAQYDAELYKQHQQAVRGKTDAHRVFKDVLGARYLHVEKISKSRALLASMSKNHTQFKLLYEDNFTLVFEVL
jgi:hypothetical protein